MAGNRKWKRWKMDREKLGWQAKRPGRKARHREFLTDELVESLEPEASERTVRDTAIPALGVRVRPSGTKTYFFHPLGRGTKKIISLGRSSQLPAEEARLKARSIQRHLASGGSIAEFTAPSSTHTFRDASVVYLRTMKVSVAWREKIENAFHRHFVPRIGSNRLSELRLEDLESVIANCPSAYGRRQRRYMLSAFLTWCTKTQRLKSNVLKGLPASPRPHAMRKPVELDAYELSRIWEACEHLPGKWPHAIRLSIALAKPVNEVLALRGIEKPSEPVPEYERPKCFSQAYLMHIAEGQTGSLFVAPGKFRPMQFQSRIIKMIRTELPWLGRFTMGDIVQGSLNSLTILREPETQWNEFHPDSVRHVSPAQAPDEEIEI